MCLLLALKIKFPSQVHLLRGNHEDINLNTTFGFSEECHKRLHEEVLDELSIFRMFNDLFRYLPLAAVVNDCILCIHGGIGSSFTSLNQIDKI
jgi:protein phosphatase